MCIVFCLYQHSIVGLESLNLQTMNFLWHSLQIFWSTCSWLGLGWLVQTTHRARKKTFYNRDLNCVDPTLSPFTCTTLIWQNCNMAAKCTVHTYSHNCSLLAKLFRLSSQSKFMHFNPKIAQYFSGKKSTNLKTFLMKTQSVAKKCIDQEHFWQFIKGNRLWFNQIVNSFQS